MFGKNPVLKQEDEAEGLTVVKGSPFYTIQGEGPFAGHPAIFLRLHGCNLRCYFCDTEFSSPADPWMTNSSIVKDIMLLASTHRAKLIVITGGEPYRQNIEPLVRLLDTLGYTIQIETAGTIWRDLTRRANNVVSPKTPAIAELFMHHAVAFKYIVGADTEFTDEGIPITNTQFPDARTMSLATPRRRYDNSFIVPIYYSPRDDYDFAKNELNLRAVGRAAMKYGHRAGVQLHKVYDLP